jgi:hypothetical protein
MQLRPLQDLDGSLLEMVTLDADVQESILEIVLLNTK